MTNRTFTVADAFDATVPRMPVDLSAPLPLGYRDAIRRAVQLRMLPGEFITYNVIRLIMAEYHGFRRSESWWRNELRREGVPRRPRGNARRASCSGLALYLSGATDGPGGTG